MDGGNAIGLSGTILALESFDAGDDPHGAAAAGAGVDVDLKDVFEALGPTQLCGAIDVYVSSTLIWPLPQWLIQHSLSHYLRLTKAFI